MPGVACRFVCHGTGRATRGDHVRRVVVALLTGVAALPTGAAAQSERLDLPIVEIDAPEGIVDEPKRTGAMRLTNREGRTEYSGPVGVEVRGFSSQDAPKKSYAVEIRDRSGEHRNVSLLDMPKEDDWVLIASYEDESLLRNFVAYSTARWLGRYAARTRLVEVAVNDNYEGVYLLAEDLKLHESRVAVDASDISGGYLLEMISMERAAGEEFFTTPVRRQPIVYDDPNYDDLSATRARWIRRYVSRFERRLYSDRFRHPRRGYRRYLEMPAAVDFVLLNELFRNADTFRHSTYMHKGVGGKLVLGPLWDFDHAMANNANDYSAEWNHVSGWQYGASPWAGRLYADRGFRRAMVERWRNLRRQGLLRHLLRRIDRGNRQVAEAQERNFARWPIFAGNDAEPADPRTGAPPANHAQAVDYLKWWLRSRTKWIDRNIKQLRP